MTTSKTLDENGRCIECGERDRLDGFLSRKAQEIDPTALVVRTLQYDPAEGWGRQGAPWMNWVLRRPGHPDMRLGTRADSSFGEAQQALSAWIRSQRAQTPAEAPVCRNCGQTPCRPTCVLGDPVGARAWDNARAKAAQTHMDEYREAIVKGTPA